MSDPRTEIALSAPPTAVLGLSLAGVGLQNWVLILTLCWLSFQICYFVYQRVKEFTDDDTK